MACFCRLNFSYVVKVDVGAKLSVPGRATLVWPHILDSTRRDGNLVEFPTTTIGSSHVCVHVHAHVHVHTCACRAVAPLDGILVLSGIPLTCVSYRLDCNEMSICACLQFSFLLHLSFLQDDIENMQLYPGHA